MEKQLGKQAAAAPADSGEEGALPPDAGAQKHPQDQMTLLLRLRAQTKQQLLEYKSMVDANEEKTPEEIIPEKHIETMQLSTALRKNLEESNIQNSELMENMKHILKLNKIIMTSQQESWDLEAKLLNVKKKRFELKRASEQKFLEVQTEKNKQKDDLDSMENSDKIKTLKQKLQMEIQITTVIQHVFQNLILGSKVNWAEDSALKETVLQLEKNLTMM
ncbi:centromere protein H isoform X2 [Phyllostomus hastatus]|uniref:centromere protein H isoform X2 n=1 Tax=Phyllostomus hastatus TaxID=9423 RepID=UPI001E68591C|nr:centromere protein H isoform X2 [Phyllostomus hastatus]